MDREKEIGMKTSTRPSIGLLALFIVLVGTGQTIGQEKAKPATSEATVKVFVENDKVRVFEIRFKPGDQGANVARPARVLHVLKGGTLMRTFADGKSDKRAYKTGDVVFEEAAQPFVPKNIGKSDLVFYVVFVK
jgi:hypothetical protein